MGKEYLPLIAARKKWGRKTESLQSGDVVYICEPTGWLKGIIDDVFYDVFYESIGREI